MSRADILKINWDIARARVDQLESQVRDLTSLKNEIDRMRFSAESEVDQQDKEIERLHAAAETAEKEHLRIVCKWQDLIHMPQNALVAQFESENAGLRDDGNAAIKRAEKAEAKVRGLTGEREREQAEHAHQVKVLEDFSARDQDVIRGLRDNVERLDELFKQPHFQGNPIIPPDKWAKKTVMVDSEWYEKLRQLAGMRGA